MVFNDMNADTAQDTDEDGLSGVSIELLGSNGNVVATTMTNAGGAYSFVGIPPGDYVVRETDPDGFISTTDNTVPVSVLAGDVWVADFGDHTEDAETAIIRGVVFNDMNNNDLCEGETYIVQTAPANFETEGVLKNYSSTTGISGYGVVKTVIITDTDETAIDFGFYQPAPEYSPMKPF